MQRPPFPSVPPLHPWKWRLTASFLSPLACPPPPSPADTQVEKPQISAGQPEPSTTVLFPSTLLIRVRAVRGPSGSHSLRFSCRKSIFSLPSSFLRLTRISIRVSLPLHPLCRPPLLPTLPSCFSSPSSSTKRCFHVTDAPLTVGFAPFSRYIAKQTLVWVWK